MEMSHQSGTEAESLLRPDQRNAVMMPGQRQGRWDGAEEKAPFLRNEPVKLTPAWEGTNLPNDTLNLKGIAMDLAPPKDKWNLIFLTLMVHGLGTLTAWNMFITAKDYFVDYKLANAKSYSDNFLTYVGWASQIPNLFFSWLNVFVKLGGNLTTRIVWSLIMEVIIFVITVILAMVDSKEWPAVFFWLTMVTVFLLNAFNAIFQNSVYGVAARLPPSYTGAVVLGSNICGTLVVLLSWTSKNFDSLRTAAIYYFIGGMFVLLICFDTYFALPLNRRSRFGRGAHNIWYLCYMANLVLVVWYICYAFAHSIGNYRLKLFIFYRYHDTLQQRTMRVNPALAATNPNASPGKEHIPYGTIFRQSALQLYNVFFTFFVSLAVFPAVNSDINASSPGFLGDNFGLITCYLTFNLMAMIGNITASLWQFPGPRLLTIFTTVRVLFIPFFLVCKYEPREYVRTLPVLVRDDWLYWAMSALLGWSSGHGSSLGMMYVSGTVAPEHAATAGMIGAGMLVTGIMSGITFTRLCPIIVTMDLWKGM